MLCVVISPLLSSLSVLSFTFPAETGLSHIVPVVCIDTYRTQRRRAYNILQQIERLSMDEGLTTKARRMASRSGMPLDPPPPPMPEEHVPAVEQRPQQSSSHANANTTTTTTTNIPKPMGAMINTIRTREEEVNERLSWEQKHKDKSEFMNKMKDNAPQPRFPLSARMASNGGGSRDGGSIDIDPAGVLDPMITFARDRKSLKDTMDASSATSSSSSSSDVASNDGVAPPRAASPSLSSKDKRSHGSDEGTDGIADDDRHLLASAKSSELIARAGSGSAFTGSALGVGGLDDVLSQIQRRVWIPLAAPPALLDQLGISPVRGLLLYGHPGCGKTLLARKLGGILSPCRPITIVSGPEIMDKFVGSSEKNLREIFDSPPEIYYEYKKNYGDEMSKQALHVIVLDGERDFRSR